MTPPNRLAITLGTAQLFGWGLTYYVPAVATQAVAQGLGAAPASVLGGFSLALLINSVVAPEIGRRIDRHGGRPVMALGTLVQATGLLILAGSTGLVQWYAGWGVVGLGMAATLYDAAFATAGRILGRDARGTITGIALIGGFASTLGWPLGAALIPAVGWQLTLVVYAGMLVSVNVPVILLGVPHAPSVAPLPPKQAGGRPARAGLTFAAMASFFTVRAVIATVIAVSAPALLRGVGLGPAQAVAVASLIGPAQVSMRMIQALFGGRWTAITTSWVGALSLPAVTLVLVAAVLAPGPYLYPASLIFVLGYGMSNGILTISRGTLPLYLFGAEGYATLIGRMAMPVMLAQAASPLLAAPLVSSWPAVAVFLALGVVSLLAAACLIPLRAPR